MQPKSIKKVSSGEIAISWTDSHESNFTLKSLRDFCPCAGCQGEDNLLYHHPPIPRQNHPEMYNLVNLQPVGSYAVQIQWGDGHNAGIYTWEYLQKNCSCLRCTEAREKKS